MYDFLTSLCYNDYEVNAINFCHDLCHKYAMHASLIFYIWNLVKQCLNPLNTSPKYTRAGVYGKCVLKENQIVFNGLI